MTIDLPRLDGGSKRLTITSSGALKNQYVKSVKLNGQHLESPFITYEQFIDGGEIVYELSDKPEAFGNDPEVVKTLGPYVPVPM
jgi:putative alpha-1,2-mannosidase